MVHGIFLSRGGPFVISMAFELHCAGPDGRDRKSLAWRCARAGEVDDRRHLERQTMIDKDWSLTSID